MTHRFMALGLAALGVAVVANGCAEDSDLFADVGATGAGGGSTSTTSSAQGGDATSTTTSANGGAGGMGGSGSVGGSGGTGGGSCMPSSTAGTTFRDLDMIIVVDRSGSMGVSGKLDQVKGGINKFAADTKSSNTYLSLVYQPRDDQNQMCDPNAYNPADLQRTQVPMGAMTVAMSLNPIGPNGLSPWAAPLTGGIGYASTVHSQLPQGEAVVVFMVDSQPNTCQENQAATAAINVATQGLAGGIRTFAIGLEGIDLTVLSQLAAAGGTGAAVDQTTTMTLANLASELEAIRSRAIACELVLPPLPMGVTADQVNLSYTPGGNGVPQDIPRVTGDNSCGGGAGWYYEDGNGPSNIILCPATCTSVKTDPAFLTELAFGCPTLTR